MGIALIDVVHCKSDKQKGVKDAFPVHGRWDVAVSTDDLDLKSIAEIGMNIYKAVGVEIVETLVGFPEQG